MKLYARESRDIAVHVAAAVTVTMFIVAGWVETPWFWGINHLYFLGLGTKITLSLAAALMLFLPSLPMARRSHSLLEAFDRVVFGETLMSKAGIAIFAVGIFYFLRLETFFLGDGYTCLNVFGDGDAYVHKWVEYGSIHLVRTLQEISGGYTKETAKTVFQILSISSGGVAMYFMFGIVRYLCRTAAKRIIGLTVLLFSGSILLFFGYIEFYPLLWATVLAFIYLALRAVIDNKSLLSVVFALLVAIGVHAQAIILLPSFLFLLIKRIGDDRLKRAVSGLAILAGAASGAVFLWMLETRIEFAAMFLPPFTGRMPTPEYAILSPAHLLDILNLLLLMYPGIFLALTLIDRNKFLNISARRFLLAASLPSLAFLFLIDPALGLARDWDLLSITLLCPMLLVISYISQPQSRTSTGALRLIGICIVITVSFLMANFDKAASEDRFLSLLEYGGLKDPIGWEVLIAYQEQNGNKERLKEISAERDSIFTDYAEMDRLRRKIGAGIIPNPEQVSELIERNPYDANFLQFAGLVYVRRGQLAKAEEYYDLAVRLKPDNRFILVEYAQLLMRLEKYAYALRLFGNALALAPRNPIILETMGIAYYRLNNYDSALAVADSLFADDRNSPGGHLLDMIVAVAQAEKDKARIHYLEYLRYGKNRSDYQRIKRSYQLLLDR